MKVHLIKKQTIEQYIMVNPQGRTPFRLWVTTINEADWADPEDILETFRSTDLLGNGTDRAVFNIGGNNYRMICHYVFGERRCICSFVGLAPMLNIRKFARETSSIK
jgi:mRNA interferase HigB